MAQRYNVGIEIGKHTTKIVLLKGDKNSWSLEDYKILETPVKAYLAEGRLNVDACVGIIEPAIKEFGKKNLELNFVINSKKLITRQKNFPKLPMKNLEKIVEMEVEQMLGMDKESFVYDYKILEEEEEGLRGIISYVPRDVVADYIAIGKAMNIKISALDSYFNSVQKYFDQGMLEDSRNVLVVDIGAKHTRFVIIKGRSYYEYFDIEIGGDNLNSQISQIMGVTLEEAEKLKRNANLGAQSDNVDLSDERTLYLNITVKKNYERILNEIVRIKNFFKTRVFNQDIDEILLIGNAVKIAGLEEYLSNESRTDVRLVELEMKASMDKMKMKKQNELIPAIGSALRR